MRDRLASVSEGELVRERTLAGLASAPAPGRNGGRPTIMTADKLAAARRMYEQRELSGEQIARAFGVSRSTLYRALSKAGAVGPVAVLEPKRERGAPMDPRPGVAVFGVRTGRGERDCARGPGHAVAAARSGWAGGAAVLPGVRPGRSGR